MLKKLLLLVVLVYWVQSSYSESIAPYYGYTGNAASGGNTWSMDTYLPSGIPGLDINGVIYNYTIQKQIQDSVTVNVQNENANGTGYIFRETDEWRPGSLGGTQINKVVPVVPSNRSLWGDGSIEVEGNGSVTDPTVVYTYRVDPCYNPQFDPNCPGYEVPVPSPPAEIDVYDPLNDPNVSLNNESQDEVYEEEDKKLSEEELAEKEKSEKEKSKERLEKALAAADNSALFANALSNSQLLSAMNAAVQMNQYYAANIDGGEYRESVTLDGGNIPDNPQGRRLNFSTQKLHQEMVEEQYK